MAKSSRFVRTTALNGNSILNWGRRKRGKFVTLMDRPRGKKNRELLLFTKKFLILKYRSAGEGTLHQPPFGERGREVGGCRERPLMKGAAPFCSAREGVFWGNFEGRKEDFGCKKGRGKSRRRVGSQTTKKKETRATAGESAF